MYFCFNMKLVKSKHLILLLLTFAFWNSKVFAQPYVDIGGNVGLANYSGDLSPSNVGPIIAQSHLSMGAFVKLNMNKHFSINVSGVYAGISGADSKSGSESQMGRGLDFYSDIYELSTNLEVNIFPFFIIEGDTRFTPYVSLGFGAFKFDPRTRYEGNWVRLQPLGTEGQGTTAFPNKNKYSLVELNIPFGGGVKFKLSDKITGFASLNWRWTFTDYIDDVSTVYVSPEILTAENGALAAILSNKTGEPVMTGDKRGGETVNDYYFTGTVGLSFALHRGGSNISLNKGGFKIRKRRKVVCPKF